jgi:hypothetical protein
VNDERDRFYLPRGTVAHYLADYLGQRSGRSLCGISVWLSENWLGTGSQREYEHAASLPLCKRCVAR